MLRIPAFLFAATVLGCTVSGCTGDSPEPAAVEAAKPATPSVVADVVYTNGKIYTVNQGQPWAEAVAIKDGKFLLVGTNADMDEVRGESTELVDLGGRMAMPGLIDVHNHAMGASMGKANLYIKNPNDADAIIAEIKAFAAANPVLPHIRGEAWNLEVFPGNSPRKEVLDAIVPDRPVYLFSQTGHDAWVNSKTLELIGITAKSEQDNRFIWDVDPDSNEPTGTIREFTMSLVEQALEATDAERIAPPLAETLEVFSQHGFTSIKLAEGEVPWVKAANLLDQAGKLDIRLFPSWFHRAHNGAMTPEEAFEVAGRWQEFQTDRVYPRYVKMYADGSSGSHSTLLLEDYSDRPGDKGSTSYPYETYVEDFARINDMGLGVIVHVFGDGSSIEMVNAFEEVRKRNGDNGVPLHFSHSFMTRKEEIEKLANISDVCMDFMTLQYPHPAIENYFVAGIGEKRYNSWLKVKSAVEAGVPYTFGSDWPAALEPVLNAFFQMQGFVTRRDPNNPDYGTLNPDQAITLEQAVRGFTLGGAECLGFDWPDKLGSIEKGKMADFIVVDRNVFEIPIEELQFTQVELTIVDGELVFDRKAAEAALEVVKIEITNPELKNAVDAAELDYLVEDEMYGGSVGCLGDADDLGAEVPPGVASAPAEVNAAFVNLSANGYGFARPARSIHWKKTGADYWIQWTIKDETAVLWAYDPEGDKVVEILQVSE